jgi:hypothetical protein
MYYQETLEPETEELPVEAFEYPDAAEIDSEFDTEDAESPLDDADEIEYASQLLEITSDEELDQFLGGLFKKVWKGVKKVGKPLGGILKGVAKVGLPIAGKVAGSFFGGPVGGMIGGQVGSAATKVFGLEVEGLSAEDQDFEIARRYVRFAAAAANKAGRMPAGSDPTRAAQRAVRSAARRYAPGLLRPGKGRPRRPGRLPRPGFGGQAAYGPPPEVPVIPSHGHWQRRGRQVIVFNCSLPGDRGAEAATGSDLKSQTQE